MAKTKVRQTKVRKGMPSTMLTRAEFAQRLGERFHDPAFAPIQGEIGKITAAAWDAYADSRKAPYTRRAGAGFADPDYELSTDWLTARAAIAAAGRRQKLATAPSRILLINGSPRSDQTCPGEISKSWRLAKIAKETLRRARGVEVELLDLSRLTSEFGRQIHPCKACVSTAMPLCHWPCSCYPNHSLGQVKTGWPRSIRCGWQPMAS